MVGSGYYGEKKKFFVECNGNLSIVSFICAGVSDISIFNIGELKDLEMVLISRGSQDCYQC